MGYATDWTLSNLTDSIDYVCSAASNGVMYASTNYDNPIDETGIIAKSTDFGHTWTEVQDDVGQYGEIVCSADGQYVYAEAFLNSTSTNGIYKSTDSGATWTFIDGVDITPRHLCCSSDGQHVYYSTSTIDGFTVYKTSYGLTPVEIYNDPTNYLTDISCSGDGNVIVCANKITDNPTLGAGVISTNGGSSFSVISDLGLAGNYPVSEVSGNGQVIIIADGDPDFAISLNQGATWNVITASSDVYTISGDYTFSKIALNLGNNNIDASVDFGASWNTVVSPVGADTIYLIAQTSNGSDLILATNDSGVYYSTTFIIDSITPATGSTAGGTPVTVGGLGFDPAATAAIDGNDLTDITVVDATTITGITPAGTAGAVDVVVTNP